MMKHTIEQRRARVMRYVSDYVDAVIEDEVTTLAVHNREKKLAKLRSVIAEEVR